ncbi:MAG: hypothetical protein JNK85_25125 [Verrucomicrobiales bacterium]|nr:hypothetical protein [Verrucomicrobiales bacterium]
MEPPKYSTVRRWLLRWLILLGISLGIPHRAARAADDRGSAGERVRDFLEDPPRYASLLIQRTLAIRPISFRSEREAARFLDQWKAGTISPPAETSWFEVRYQAQPPAFFLRALHDIHQFEQVGGRRLTPLAGRYHSDWWSVLDVVPGQVQLLKSLDGIDVSPKGSTNAYHQGNQRWATEFLRLGMFEVLVETLRWQPGNHQFEAKLESGASCRGRVETAEEQESVVLWLDFPGLSQGKRIQVLGATQEGRWLPRRLVVDRWTGSLEVPVLSPYATFDVLSQVLAAEPIPRDRFSPEPYLRTNDLWVEIEHGNYFSLDVIGTNIVRTLAPPQPQGFGMRHLLRAALLIAVGGAGTWLILHYVLEWRRRCRT